MEKQDLKKAGLKITVPRLKILELLENSENRHMTAENIYKALIEADEEIGLATVYRVLTQFEAAGLVKRNNFEEGQAVFEIDDGDHHDHLVCVETGAVIEFYDEVIEERQKEIAKKHGYKLVEHSMTLYGEPLDAAS